MSTLPETIGRYRIRGLLGEGAMGVIYQAFDPEIGRAVAIKLVKAGLAGGADRAAFLERFRREARAAGRCMHPNIVAIYDFAVHEGDPYLAMEFVQGESLDRILRDRRLDAAQSVSIVAQLLQALACAHEAGIVHRDVKPANLMLLRDGRVKVADFGISRIEGSDMTQTGAVVGTPSYMSPEQCRGETVDHRTDLFSAGAILFELLAGQKLASGGSLHEVMFKLASPEPVDVAGRLPDLGEPLREVLARALAKDRNQRFASAQDMHEALLASQQPQAAGTAAVNRTAFAPLRPQAAATPVANTETAAPLMARIAPSLLATIENGLMRFLGPMARLRVRDEGRRAVDFDAFVESLARDVPSERDRRDFLNSVRVAASLSGITTADGIAARSQPGAALTEVMTRPPATTTVSTLTQKDIERAETDLARVLGPIAKVLVKKALPGADTPEKLREKLAAHLRDEAERQTFLGIPRPKR